MIDHHAAPAVVEPSMRGGLHVHPAWQRWVAGGCTASPGNLVRILVLTLLAVLTLGGAVAAEPKWLGGGGAPTVLVAGSPRGARPGDTLTVMVVVASRYAGDPAAEFRVTIPPALRLLSGDTARAGRMSAITGNYALRLAPHDTGSFVVEGRLHMDAGEQRDEAAFEMPVRVDSDTVIVEPSRYSRLESNRGGRRYRYADWWLVPLEGGEPSVVERDIEARGARATVADASPAVCPRCPAASLGDSVRFVVFVGPDGRARDWKLLGSTGSTAAPGPSRRRRRERRLDPRIAAAAEAALKRCSFHAARVDGQAVSDWVYVTIPIQRGP